MKRLYLNVILLFIILVLAIVHPSLSQNPFDTTSPRIPPPKSLQPFQNSFNDITSRDKPEPVVPLVVRGAWFSRETNVNTFTEFDDKTMSGRGYLVEIKEEYNVNYTMIFQSDNCYHCVHVIVRTVNIIEKIECIKILC
jgi:hypothetical protein